MIASEERRLLIIFESLCDRAPSNIYIRRWGNREKLKGYKIIILIRKYCPEYYQDLFEIFNCKDKGDLAKSVSVFLWRRIKSFKNIYRLGDLCRELRKTVVGETI